jgi:hypothetical protein
VASLRQAIQKQVKVNKSRAARPARIDPPNPLVFEWFGQTQPTLKVIAGPDVITREDMGPPQAAEQDVLRSPAPYSTKFTEALYGLVVRKVCQPFQGSGSPRPVCWRIRAEQLGRNPQTL